MSTMFTTLLIAVGLGGTYVPIGFPEPIFVPPVSLSESEENEALDELQRSIAAEEPVALIHAFLRLSRKTSNNEAVLLSADKSVCIKQINIAREMDALETADQGIRMDGSYAPDLLNLSASFFEPTLREVVIDHGVRTDLYAPYMAVANPEYSLNFIATTPVGVVNGKPAPPYCMYTNDGGYAIMTLESAFSTLEQIAVYRRSLAETQREEILNFTRKHAKHHAETHYRYEQEYPPSAWDDLRVREHVAGLLEQIGTREEVGLCQWLSTDFAPYTLARGVDPRLERRKSELIERLKVVAGVLSQGAEGDKNERSDAFPSPYFPKPFSGGTSVSSHGLPSSGFKTAEDLAAFVDAADTYIPVGYAFHGRSIIGALNEMEREQVLNVFSNIMHDDKLFHRLFAVRAPLQDLEDLAASTFEESLYDEMLVVPQAMRRDTFSPTGVSVRLLYLAKVNPETTLDALLRCGKQADEKSDYIYDTRTAQPADGRDTARTERRYIATWKEAFEILSYMADVSPEALRARADDARRFVADYAFLYANRSTRAGSGESYSPWNDFHMRNFALDVMAVVGTKDDAELIHRLGNEIRDVDFIEFYQDIVDRQHAHLKDKAAGLLEKTGE